jgi:RHS repeat-associated protein
MRTQKGFPMRPMRSPSSQRARWIVLLAFFATSSPALATEEAIFGPAQFTRTAGPPNQFSAEIALPPTLVAPFRLHVQNGSPDGTHRISSATITLNGAQVAGPSDFNQQVAAFDRTVALQPNNTLQVRLTSAPGSFLLLTLFGTIPPPTLTRLLPPALPITQGGTGILTATISAVQPSPTTIGLISDHPAAATVPPTATVPSGQLTVPIAVTGLAPSAATITATLNESHISSTVTVAPSGPTLTSLLPPTLQVGQGASGPLTVTISAAQATDTVVHLASSAPGVVGLPPSGAVTVPTGQLSQSFAVFGLNPGPATITATLNGATAQSQVSVVVPVLTVVSLLPPVLPLTEGSNGTLIVTLNAAQSSDSPVALSTSDPTVVGLPPNGTITVPAQTLTAAVPIQGLALGLATVTASLNGTTATAAIEVLPPPPDLAALTCPATLAVAATSLCTLTLDATPLADTVIPLVSSAPGIASVPPTVTIAAETLAAGVAVTGVAAGLATITAGPLNGATQTATITIIPPPPTLVSLTPATATLFVGATATLTLTLNAAQATDTTVVLTGSAPGLLSVPPSLSIPAGSGSASVTVVGLAPGSATLLAGPLNGTQVTSDITVAQLAPAVTALAPATLSLPKGLASTLTLSIAPTQSDPTVVPLGSSAPAIAGVPPTATVPAGGRSAAFPVLAESEGTATVSTGPLNGTSRSATVTVTPPELLALAVTPASPSIAKGQTQPFTATGTFTDARTQDLTGSTAWGSSNTAVATVTSPGGLATGQSVGQVTITATVQGLSATATLTVTPPVLATLALSPSTPTRNVGEPLQFQALGTLTDGTTQDLTGAVTWSSSNPEVATITSPGGLATLLAPGSTTITAAHAGSGLTASTLLTILLPPPTITGFAPAFGQVGDLVTITGTHFVNIQAVTFNGTSAPGFSVNSSTSITVAVPLGATTGPLAVTTSAGTATSAESFVVLGPADFLLTAAPATGMAVPGMQTIFSVTAVAFGNYANLVSLAVTGLPSGATATLTPPQVAPGASALLGVTLPSTLAPGTYPFIVTGMGLVNGVLTTHSAGAAAAVLAPGTTALSGRVVTTEEAPLPNVTIRLGSLTTQTDGGGNFLLSNPPAGPQVVLIDGSTASTPTVSYPTIPLTVTIAPGQVTSLGLTPHLHAQPVGHTVPLIPGQAATVTDPALPGFLVQIPAGVTILGWDGQPNTQVGMRVVPPDRSPLPPLELPPGFVAGPIYMFYFGKVGGGTPTAPVPIIGPNEGGGFPGEQVDLYFYDEAPDGSRPNAWAKYGTGTVSSDGTQIVPDINPATGKPYGMPRFCCGAWRVLYPPPPQTRPPSATAVNLPALGQGPSGGEPVDLASGLFVMQKTDLVLPGRVPLALTRTYRTLDDSPGPFGPGTSHAYEISLQSLSVDALLLTLSGNSRVLFARQPDGRFINSTEPGLRGTAITLSGSTRVLTFKDGATWTFDGNGRLTAQRDRNGNTVTITRDGQGRVASLTEPAGRQLLFSYSGTGLLITQVTDPLGRTVRYAYDGSGRLVTVTDAASGVTTYTYDTANRLLTITDPRGILFLRNEYDSAGRVSRQTQADGSVFTFAYTLTSGVVTQTVVTDPKGNRTTSRFNTQGYLIAQTDALGQPTSFERQVGTNLLLTTTDPLGRVTRFTYDGKGNVATITDPAGNVRIFTYDPTFNRLTSLTDPLGNVTRFEYDATGNLTAVVDPLTERTTIAYNSAGQPISTTDPLNNTTHFEYDGTGNLSTITDPLGNNSSRTYDGVSRLLSQTDPRGKLTSVGYDPLNRLTQLTDALSGLTRFTYDGNGNLLTVTDALNHVITHEYDSMDRLSRRLDQLGQAETFAYDGVGNLLSTTNRKGQTTTFAYDALNRRTKATYADGSPATFTYDAAGRLVQADDTADPHRPITLAYDVLDRLAAETTGLGTVAYEYDTLGRRTQMRVNELNPVTYTYDATSRLRTITQAPANPVSIDYDAVSRRTKLTLPNGVSTEYEYDAASRVTALIYHSAAGLLGDLTYTYDPAGNRTGVGGSFARTLLPDPVASATYDAANRQFTFGERQMTYDTNGNLASLADPSGTTTYLWDARNRLTALTTPGTSATFLYDALGRRAGKTINGLTTQDMYDSLDIVNQLDASGTTSYLRSLNLDEIFSFIKRDGAYYSIYNPLGSTLAVLDQTANVVVQYAYEPFGRTSSTNSAFSNPFQYTGREHDGSTGLYYYRARYYTPHTARFLSEDPKESPLFNPGACRSDYSPSVARYIDIDRGLSLLMMLSFLGAPSANLPTAFVPNPQHLHLYTYANDNPINRTDPLGLISGPQSLGCDYISRAGGVFASPCGTKCCNKHDDCYKRAPQRCSMWSWPDMLTGVNPFNLSCQLCNMDVVICLAKASLTGGRKPCP